MFVYNCFGIANRILLFNDIANRHESSFNFDLEMRHPDYENLKSLIGQEYAQCHIKQHEKYVIDLKRQILKQLKEQCRTL